MDTASPRFSNALVTALALILTYVLAFYWNLEKPYWAGFTVFMVSLPTIGQSLLKGLLRILGTFLGAGVALLLYGLLHQNRFWLLLALSLYLCLCVRLSQNNRAYGYFYFMSSVVTAIIVLMAVQGADTIFHLAVYRSEETVLGIAVYTICSALFSARLSISDLPSQTTGLWERHRALLALSREKTDVTHIQEVYAELAGAIRAAALLLPSAQLESYQIWRKRRQWAELFARSAELALLQRRWASLSVALRDIESGALPKHYTENTASLEAALSEKGPSGTLDTAQSTRKAPAGPPGQTREDADDRASGNNRNNLFQQQMTLILRLKELSAFLLRGGPAPSAPPFPPARTDSPNPAEAARNVKQTFFTFWLVAPIWVLLHPPGPDNVIFLMLAVMMGLSVMLAGKIDPVGLFLTYCQGALVTAVLYLLVYPHLASLELFLAMLFISSFLLSYIFYTPAQTLSKLAYLMPWLSMTDFTNVPTYQALPFISGSFTLLMSVALVALLQYLFFSGNFQAQFLRRQNAFFRSMSDILDHLASSSPQTSFPTRLLLRRDRLRVRRIAAQLTDLSSRLDPNFLTPGLAGHLALGIEDMARSVDRLAILAPHLPPLSPLPSGQRTGVAAVPADPGSSGKLPAFDVEIARAGERGEVLKQAVLELPGETGGASGPTQQRREAVTLIKHILTHMSEYRDVARSANWKMASENRF